MKKTFLFPFFCILLSVSVAAQKQRSAINHIALSVHDLKKSSDFYQHIIQLDTVPEPFHDGRHVWLAIGGASTLHLIGGATINTTHEKNTHICFSVTSFDSFMENLHKAGVVYEDLKGNRNAVTTRVDGIKQIYLQDPDGYWIEINNSAQ